MFYFSAFRILYIVTPSIFSAITPDHQDRRRSITTGKAQTISIDISGLDSAAIIKWIDPEGNDIPAGDSTNYVVEPGSFSGGDQTTRLTLKSTFVSTINTAITFVCSVSSGDYSGSGEFRKEVVFTPIGEL